MGSSSSKAASKTASVAASTTARKYPTRPPPPPPPPSTSRATNPPPSTSRHSRNTNAKPNSSHSVGPTVHPPPRAASAKDYGIERDAEDSNINPGLHARLQKLGPVTPSPTMSNSSTFNYPPPSSSQSSTDPSLSHFKPSASTPSQSIFPQTTNPAVSLLTARYRLAEEAEREFANVGRRGEEGRRFLDVGTIRKILEMREKGVEVREIEKRLGVAKGVVGVLGVRGLVGAS